MAKTTAKTTTAKKTTAKKATTKKATTKAVTKKEETTEQPVMLNYATAEYERTGPGGLAIDFESIEPQTIEVEHIFRDNNKANDPIMRKETQPRSDFNNDRSINHKNEIIEFLQRYPDKDTPPVDLVVTEEGRVYIVSGFHRIPAYQKVERKTIPARVAYGTKEDAIRTAIGTNATHGLKRTTADKQKAVKMALADPEIAELSDTQIAELCGVSSPTVAAHRTEMPKTVKTASGKTMKRRQAEPKPPEVQEEEPEDDTPELVYPTEDKIGGELPDYHKETFAHSAVVDKMLRDLNKQTNEITRYLKGAAEEVDDPVVFDKMHSGIIRDVREIRSAIKSIRKNALPYAVSPFCRGRNGYPESESLEDGACPITGAKDVEGNYVNVGWLSEGEYKEHSENPEYSALFEEGEERDAFEMGIWGEDVVSEPELFEEEDEEEDSEEEEYEGEEDTEEVDEEEIEYEEVDEEDMLEDEDEELAGVI